MEPPLVPPIHPLGGGQLDLLEVPPGASPADELGLVETDHRLGQGVVVAVAAGTDRGNSAGLGQTLGVPNGQVLHAAVGVVDEAFQLLLPAHPIAISSASRASSAWSESETRQPTMERLKASITK